MSKKQAMPERPAINEKQKKDRRAGFTLAEMLAAVLIMLMASAVVAAGIPAAVRAYQKVTRSANAEVLLSTSVSAMRDQLGTARDIKVAEDSKSVMYFSSDTGSFSRLYLSSDSSNGVIMLQEYLLPEEVAGTGSGGGFAGGDSGRQLVTEAASTKDLYITYDSLSYEGGILQVNGLSVRLISSGDTLTAIESLQIRSIFDEE